MWSKMGIEYGLDHLVGCLAFFKAPSNFWVLFTPFFIVFCLSINSQKGFSILHRLLSNSCLKCIKSYFPVKWLNVQHFRHNFGESLIKGPVFHMRADSVHHLHFRRNFQITWGMPSHPRLQSVSEEALNSWSGLGVIRDRKRIQFHERFILPRLIIFQPGVFLGTSE